jgi:hypothetical protein
MLMSCQQATLRLCVTAMDLLVRFASRAVKGQVGADNASKG